MSVFLEVRVCPRGNILITSLFFGIMPTMALSQQAGGIEEVVVTADKRETTILETPMNITVLTGDVLQTTNADDFSDIAALTPGLTFTDSGPGQKRFALRGLQSAGEPEVALYYDEIPIAGLPGASLDTGDDQPDLKLWDIDRVEVLRGPQGTLYGNGSIGGAIRIISKRPDLSELTEDVEISSAVTDGGAPSFRASGTLNVPIIDGKLGVRLAVYDRNEGGWIDDIDQPNIALPQIGKNNLNWERTFGGRASISYQANADWNITGIAYYQDTTTGNSSDIYPQFATSDDAYVSKAFVRTPWRDKSEMLNVISNYDFGWSNLVATTSYQRRTVDQNLDTTRYLVSQFGCSVFTWGTTCSGPPIVPADSFDNEYVDSWSGEMRLVSSGTGPLQWTVGVFVQDSSAFRYGQVAPVDSGGYIQFGSTGAALNRLFARTNSDIFDQYAFFAEGSYELWWGLKGTVGLRWFDSYRSDEQIIEQQFFPNEPVGPEPFQNFSESALFKKFELSRDIGNSGLIYAEAAQGFRAGGPNYPGGFTETAPPYGADAVWNYELGWKISLGRLYWDGDIFDMEWSHVQQLVPTQLFSYIENAGNARSNGFETSANFVAAEGLTLGAGLTYSDARLVGPQPASADPSQQLLAGQNLANVPHWTATGSITYERQIGDLLASIRADFSYESSKGDLVENENPAFFSIPSERLANLHVGIANRQNLRLSLNIQNLFNGYEENSGKVMDGNSAETVTAARPRTISLTIDKAF